MDNFWNQINKPIFALAPMEDVTDTAFRELVLQISDPNKLQILFTEFTSVEGMNHPVGRKHVAERLVVTETERAWLNKTGVKLVAQIWGKDPELFFKTAKILSEEYQFDGIDVNMGCPVKNVFRNGYCSALIDKPTLAQEIMLATKEGSSLPVSVKTRTGIREHETERWITQLCEVKPAAITLHGRTQKMFSEKPADWNEVAKGVKVKDAMLPDMPFLGNGDVWTWEQGNAFCEQYGTDGVMIGRGIFQNPWFFNPDVNDLSKEEKLKTLLHHVDLYEAAWKGNHNFSILKRFFKIYASGFSDAAALRAQLMVLNNPEDVRALLNDFVA